MWRAASGFLVLHRTEWALFRQGIGWICEAMRVGGGGLEPALTGVAVFDRLEPNQQLALLARVGNALCDEHVSAPALTVYTEGTVAAVFNYIALALDLELDDRNFPDDSRPNPRAKPWTKLIVAALQELARECSADGRVAAGRGPSAVACDECADDDDALRGSASERRDEHEVWRAALVGVLARRVLWGERGSAWAGLVLDSPPELSRAILKELGVDREYYTALPPDPTRCEMIAIQRTLAELCGQTGIADEYHGLTVGPCRPEELAREVECAFVSRIALFGREEFDCPYADWCAQLREEVLEAEARGALRASAPPVVLTHGQRRAARRAARTGKTLVVRGRIRVEPRGCGWVVRRERQLLARADPPRWEYDDGRPGMGLRFPHPQSALIAALVATAIEDARVRRCQGALQRLGYKGVFV